MSKFISTTNEKFTTHFPQNDFAVTHELSGHPLFSLDYLIEKSASLSAKNIEYNMGEVQVDHKNTPVPLNGLSPQETIRRIEECKSWIVLKNVESIPEYKALLDECLDPIFQIPSSLKNLHNKEAFIFVSSPNSVTPYHIDPEHNFLLQIKGTKTMHVWKADDKLALPEKAIEDTVYGPYAHRNLPFKDEFQSHAESYQLEAGGGLYVPVHAPHWVKNGPAVSVSFSITFRSSFSERKALLHRFNAKLRSRGLAPRPVGASAVNDTCKFLASKVVDKVSHIIGRK
jgi:hypothetical protein